MDESYRGSRENVEFSGLRAFDDSLRRGFGNKEHTAAPFVMSRIAANSMSVQMRHRRCWRYFEPDSLRAAHTPRATVGPGGDFEVQFTQSADCIDDHCTPHNFLPTKSVNTCWTYSLFIC